MLEKRTFEEISVSEITELAEVNRATFYDHFPDKFALLESLVAARFFGLLEARKIRFDGTCPSAIKALVLVVSDFLTTERGLSGFTPGSSFQPLVESTVILLIRRVILDGLEAESRSGAPHREITAAAASWAIYGSVREWVNKPDRLSSDQLGDAVMALIAPVLGFSGAAKEPHPLLK